MISSFFVLPAAFAAALVLVGLVRAYALRRGILDVPNERSSHTRPTPRGGSRLTQSGAHHA